jgi:ribonucleoside-diphosphate reductase alpha chain
MAYQKWTPNSPTLMNAGDELQQLSACFVRSPQDDIDDIHQTVAEGAKIFKSGGGLGYGFQHLRPYGDQVGSTGGIASGPISFMRTFDQMCATIAQGGKRRGAQMGIMKVSHPDVIHFIHAKRKDVSLKETLKLNDPDDFTHNSYEDALEEARELIDEEGRVPEHLRNAVEGHLSNFNISVGVTDDFMQAVKNDEEFTFTNPRTGEPHIATEYTEEMYGWHDLDEYVEPGEELSIPAELIWERIVEGAHENGEPGVVYIDRINKEHSFPDLDGVNSRYKINATNPCGEQPLMENEACNLGHINLSTVVAKNAPTWNEWRTSNLDAETDAEVDDLKAAVEEYLTEAVDWDSLNRRINLGTHFLDNVVTMSNFPIPKIEETVANNRKIGLGIMGLAQMYVQMGIRYGSDPANEIARELMTHINHESKAKSQEMAMERGSFANHKDSKYANPTNHPDWFQRMTGEDPEDWEDGYPIRNQSTTTIAPTGSTSMIADTSGGCEPIYNVAYYKNVSGDVQGDEMLVEFDKYFLEVLEANDIDVEAVKQEAEEQMQANEFDGIEGLSNVPDVIAEVFVTTSDLSAREHASVQCACQQGVDSAISKTTNAPNDSTVEDAKEIFEYIYDNGGKGVTYYRDGTRSKQVLTTRAQNREFSEMTVEEVIDQIEEAFGSLTRFVGDERIAEELNGHLSDLLAEVDGETFTQKQPRPDVLHGVTQRIDTGYGKLYVNINEDPEADRPFELFANIGNSGGFTASFTEALAKTISTALRSGVDPKELGNELQGIRSPKVAYDKGEQIQSIPDAIGTAMQRYLDGEIGRAFPDQTTIDEVTQSTEDLPSKGGDSAEQMETASGDHQQLIDQGESPECPECNSMSLYYSEGCKKCESCGWSEC